MMTLWTNPVLGATLAALARAAQPEAPSPVEAPMRDLQWGRLNFLHTTDTHGWHGGHLQEPQYSADWGDYVSFAEHLRARADADGSDLLLVDTGDRVEGNGLYDSAQPQGKYTYDIFREQDMDVICTGNHELYRTETADREYSQTVPNFPDTYIASNLDYILPETGEQVPLAQRFKRFRTKNQGIDIVAFGFLFDFTGNANNTVVQPVADVVKQKWFMDAINVRTAPDLFVVIGHVGIRMEEYQTLFRAIRDTNWFTPIAFFGGHHHVRDSATYDAKAFALASGRYFETIGFLSIDGIKPKSAAAAAEQQPAPAPAAADKITFHRRYIDNNLYGLHYHTSLNATTFPTPHGQNVSAMITAARRDLDLDHVHGCAPTSLWMSRRPPGDPESIYSWLQSQVLPDVILNEKRKEKPRLAIMNTGAIRFDIFAGKFTRDTQYIVSPFRSGMNYLANVPYRIAKEVLTLLNTGGPIIVQGTDGGSSRILDPRHMAGPEQWSIHEDVIIHDEPSTSPHNHGEQDGGGQKVLSPPAAAAHDDGGEETKPDLIGGYTTTDDVSSDGDDTVHRPLSSYRMPNCIQAEINFPAEGEPEAVDLVFLDFIQPWVLYAVKFAGGGANFGEANVRRYQDGSFTDAMVGWIEENWDGDC